MNDPPRVIIPASGRPGTSFQEKPPSRGLGREGGGEGGRDRDRDRDRDGNGNGNGNGDGNGNGEKGIKSTPLLCVLCVLRGECFFLLLCVLCVLCGALFFVP
ncbi:MAG TPA: hypothetical protein VK116_05455, partial [Planctomycetota bacterium]|nr:hypothetical protein [Planctomycetota bacterium]